MFYKNMTQSTNVLGNFPLILLLIVISFDCGKSTLKCSREKDNLSGESDTIFDFGEPFMFITSYSQDFTPYSLVDKHRRTSILQEYLLVGYNSTPGRTRVYDKLNMVLLDKVKSLNTDADQEPDLVHQNLEKELYWRYFNSTGVYPWMAMVNATSLTRIPFHATVNDGEGEGRDIQYHADLISGSYHHEPQPPFDAIFEIPGLSKVLKKDKTIIEYQSFSLWRWKLSNKTVEWTDIEPQIDDNSPAFHRMDNPCIKDMFLLHVSRPEKPFYYLGSPLIQSHLKENWFYDMVTADHPWYPHAPQQIILTNDHLVVMGNSSLWISSSLNDSDPDDLNMTKNHVNRQSLFYLPSDPCSGFEDTIRCFHNTGGTSLTEHKLFYNPVCYLFQFPNFRDYIIFTVKNVEGDDDEFTVLYAAKPYMEWRILFSDVVTYKRYMKVDNKQEIRKYHVRDIVGIFFNHHSNHFDITIKASKHHRSAEKTMTEDELKDSDIFIRFSLREPRSKSQTYGNLVTHEHGGNKKELDGIMGHGIMDFAFPSNFEIENVIVNGDTQDVFFVGNQLWIAEAGGTFIYPSIPGLRDEKHLICENPEDKDNQEGSNGHEVEKEFGKIRECSFNHPDRTFLCLNEHRNLILAGRIGTRYSPTVTKIDTIREIRDAKSINGWASKYLCNLIQKNSVFFASHSGRILLWYMHNGQKSVQESSSFIQDPDSDPVCKYKKHDLHYNEMCNTMQKWKKNSCSDEEPKHKPSFRLIAIAPHKMESRRLSTDGPLVPFIVDSTSAILFEAQVPEEEKDRFHYHTYFSRVDVGQKILCTNYELKKVDRYDPQKRHRCEMYIRHIKGVDKYLSGFHTSLLVMVVKNVPMLAIPADLVVLVHPKSNKALVRINDFINEPKWEFTEEHIGQTIYIPGNFSILLSGFPKSGDKTLMVGYTTKYFTLEHRLASGAYYSFLMDMSTGPYRKAQLKNKDKIIEEEVKRLENCDKKKQDDRAQEEKTNEMIKNTSVGVTKLPVEPFFKGEIPAFIKTEDFEKELLTTKGPEMTNVTKKGFKTEEEIEEIKLEYGKVEYMDRLVWHTEETHCDYIMTLSDNPIFKSTGGRISLDLHDKVSFEVQLRSNSPMGKLMMYRPLLLVTNSNPTILRIDKKEKLAGNPQWMLIMLSPTGFRTGIAVVTVRSVIRSIRCEHTTSVTFIVLVHRDVGRRLHINYPIPLCKPVGRQGLYSKFFKGPAGCVSREEILSNNENMSEVVRYMGNRKHIAYIRLPPNYRPPSFEGSDIPTSKNIYNADPNETMYKSWYRISNETFKYDRCKGRKFKENCDCTDNDRLIDDEAYTECKEKVFYTERTGGSEALTLSAVYDRIMRDEDQDHEMFVKKTNWSVTIEEVNGRSEWFITSPRTQYLDMINSREDLSEGMRHYDMNSFSVGLLGTGLYHFKVTLGRFESFDETTGYFILFVDDNQLNSLHLFMILLGTIIFCMTLVFLGFLAARKRLSSMLPIQPMSHKRKLKLL